MSPNPASNPDANADANANATATETESPSYTEPHSAAAHAISALTQMGFIFQSFDIEWDSAVGTGPMTTLTVRLSEPERAPPSSAPEPAAASAPARDDADADAASDDDAPEA